MSAAAAGYLSDDGTTPLIKERLSRKQQVAKWTRLTLRFLLANWYKFVVLGVIITLIVLVAVKGFSIFGVILRWFQARNNWAGWGIFVGMYCAFVALFLPGVVLIIGAGFVFGFWKGLLAVWIGGAVGQALAFLLARYLLKDWVESFVKGKWAKWEYIDKAIELDGWKLVLIMRFSPLIPYNLLNIAMATTSMPFWQFTIVSAIGILWECAVFCYFGSMAENVTSIASGGGMSGPFEWVMLGVSVVMCIVGAVFVSFMIKKAIKRAEVHMSSPSLTAVAAAAMSENEDSVHGGTVGGHSRGYAVSMLEREGFLGSAGGGVNAYPRLASGTSPQFELKPVHGSGAALATGTPRSGSGKLKFSPGGMSEHGSSTKEAMPGGGPAAKAASGRLDTDLEMGQRSPIARRRLSGSLGGHEAYD